MVCCGRGPVAAHICVRLEMSARSRSANFSDRNAVGSRPGKFKLHKHETHTHTRARTRAHTCHRPTCHVFVRFHVVETTGAYCLTLVSGTATATPACYAVVVVVVLRAAVVVPPSVKGYVPSIISRLRGDFPLRGPTAALLNMDNIFCRL